MIKNSFKRLSKITLIAATFFVLFYSVYSCTNSNDEISKNELTAKVVKINLQNAKVGSNFNSDVEFIFDEVTETVVDINASQDLLNYINMTDDQLDDYVMQQMEKAADGDDDKPKHDHATCMQGCYDKFTNADGTKKPGRGGCRFACWTSTAVQIIEAIGPALLGQ